MAEILSDTIFLHNPIPKVKQIGLDSILFDHRLKWLREANLGHINLKVYACSFTFPSCIIFLSKFIWFVIRNWTTGGWLQNESLCHTAASWHIWTQPALHIGERIEKASNELAVVGPYFDCTSLLPHLCHITWLCYQAANLKASSECWYKKFNCITIIMIL